MLIDVSVDKHTYRGVVRGVVTNVNLGGYATVQGIELVDDTLSNVRFEAHGAASGDRTVVLESVRNVTDANKAPERGYHAWVTAGRPDLDKWAVETGRHQAPCRRSAAARHVSKSSDENVPQLPSKLQTTFPVGSHAAPDDW